MTRKIIISVMYAIFLVGCATPIEYLSVPTKGSGERWKIGFQNRVKFSNTNIRELIPNSESMSNWSKLLTMQFIEKNPQEYDLEASMNSRKADVSIICQNLKWDILEKSKKTIIYEMQASSCQNNTSQHVLGRMIKGNDGLHLVLYTQKKKIDSKTREQWLKNLKTSKVKKNK